MRSTGLNSLYIAEHIDIGPPGTSADGSFSAELVLPDDLPAGDHYLEAISCWGGPDGSYPQDGVAPCGTVGLGGGVNDRVARTRITIMDRGVTSEASSSTALVRGPRGPRGAQGEQGPAGADGGGGAITLVALIIAILGVVAAGGAFMAGRRA